MKAPTSLFDRPGRATAVVGAVVAVSATAAVALMSGIATADPGTAQPGKCTKNVNVRAEPDTGSRIVALCEQGTAVQVAEARDGFLRLSNLGGWAAQEYISVNGRAPAASQRSEGDDDADERRSSSNADDARERRSGRADADGSSSDEGRSGRGGTDDSSSDGSSSDGSSGDDAGADDSSSDSSSDGTTDESGSDESGSDESDESDSDTPAAPRSGGGVGGLIG